MEEAMKEYFTRVLDNIERVGWHVQGVGGCEKEKTPCFAYTVGLCTKGKPELILSGMPFEVLLHYINHISLDMVNDDKEVKAGDILYGYLPQEEHAFAVLEVNEEQYEEHMTITEAIFGEEDDVITPLQLVWCDTNGKFPWDDGFEERFLPHQELFGVFK